MGTTLVIVESPTKARTIKSYLPDGYIVEASMGSIRDLPARAAEVPEKLKKENKFGFTRTNPDGIIVDLELEEDRLYVTAISISSGDGGYAIRPGKHRTKIIETPILADWFTGKISYYSGNPVILQIKERGTHLAIKDGVLIKTEATIQKLKRDEQGRAGDPLPACSSLAFLLRFRENSDRIWQGLDPRFTCL